MSSGVCVLLLVVLLLLVVVVVVLLLGEEPIGVSVALAAFQDALVVFLCSRDSTEKARVAKVMMSWIPGVWEGDRGKFISLASAPSSPPAVCEIAKRGPTPWCRKNPCCRIGTSITNRPLRVTPVSNSSAVWAPSGVPDGGQRVLPGDFAAVSGGSLLGHIASPQAALRGTHHTRRRLSFQSGWASVASVFVIRQASSGRHGGKGGVPPVART